MNKKNLIYLLTVFLIAILMTACQDSPKQNNLNNSDKDKSITKNDSNNTKENNHTAEKKQENTNQNDIPTEMYSEEEQKEASQAFLDWAIPRAEEDRKSTRLNSSHVAISYAVFCLKKKKR